MKDIELIHSRVIENFFKKIVRFGEFKKLIIISPWISNFKFEYSGNSKYTSLPTLLKYLSKSDSYLEVLTREPIKSDDWHLEAVRQIHSVSNRKFKVHFNNDLHSKIIIAEMNYAEFCLIGSPNFTNRSLSNIEVAMSIKKTQYTYKLFNEIRSLSISLVLNKKNIKVDKI